MTQLSRTAMIPQLASSESPRIWHYGLRALYKHAQRVQFTAPRLRERSEARALRRFRVRETLRAIHGCWPVARCPSPQPSPASGARST